MTNKTISAIDHIITNSIYNNDFKTGIIKTNISDHFPINEGSKATFKRRLRKTSWDAVRGLDNPNKTYVKFAETITQIYDACFPKTKFKIKSNNRANPWIARCIAKSSKRKQKLHEKFLKNRSIQNEKIYKDYRKLFETITMKSKS